MRVVRFGVLYPGYGAESDFQLLGQEAGVEVEIVHIEVADESDSEAGLYRLGDPATLAESAKRLSSRVQSIVFACTSASFVGGLALATEQKRAIEAATGVPATSTSLAFARACLRLGTKQISIAATYSARLTDAFAGMLREYGLTVVTTSCLDVWLASASEPVDPMTYNVLKDEDLEELILGAEKEADAVVIPDTALMYCRLPERIRFGGSGPRLFANPVSMWAALDLAGSSGGLEGLEVLLLGRQL